MKLYTLAYGLLVAILLVIVIATPAFTQEKGVTTAQAVRAWDAREKKIRSARLKWTEVRTHPKKNAHHVLGLGNDKFDKDVVLRTSLDLTIEGNRLRLEKDGEHWVSENRRVEPVAGVCTFDGRRYGSTVLKCSLVGLS